jgi:hypothetical protein
MSGAGYFGLQQGGPMFTVYLLLVNLLFGIITALAARAVIGGKPYASQGREAPHAGTHAANPPAWTRTLRGRSKSICDNENL